MATIHEGKIVHYVPDPKPDGSPSRELAAIITRVYEVPPGDSSHDPSHSSAPNPQATTSSYSPSKPSVPPNTLEISKQTVQGTVTTTPEGSKTQVTRHAPVPSPAAATQAKVPTNTEDFVNLTVFLDVEVEGRPGGGGLKFVENVPRASTKKEQNTWHEVHE